MLRNLRSVGIVGLLTLAAFAGAEPSAHAAARDGVCDAGEFCLYHNSDFRESVSDFDASVANYGTAQPTCYEFTGPGAGLRQCIKNKAASAWNRSSGPVTIFYNSGHAGPTQSIAPGEKANLNPTLKNENASHRFEAGGGGGPAPQPPAPQPPAPQPPAPQPPAPQPPSRLDPGSAGQTDATRTQGQPGVCIDAKKVTKYLSARDPIFPDASHAKLTWSPRFCPNGDGWQVSGDPVVTEMGPGGVFGRGLNLEAASSSPSAVEYKGQVRECPPLGGEYAGLSYTGKVCYTLADGTFGASINPRGEVTYHFPDLDETAPSFPLTWVWTDEVA